MTARGQPGWRVAPPCERRIDLLERLRGRPTAQVGDAMHRLNGTGELRPMHRGGPLLGLAHTVRTRAGDNLMVYRALELLQPGDVLVVDGEGDCGRALVGEIVAEIARSRGAAGMVIDAAVRDAQTLAAGDFPCFARGVSLKGPYKNGPGEVGVPVRIGSMVVQPGDIVLGDADGLLAIAPQDVPAVVDAAERIAQAEQRLLASIRAGTYDFGWLPAALQRAGIPD